MYIVCYLFAEICWSKYTYIPHNYDLLYVYMCILYLYCIGEVISTASCVFIFISDIASDVMLKLLLNFGGDRKSLSKSVLRAHVKTALDEQWSRLRFGGVSVSYILYVCIRIFQVCCIYYVFVQLLCSCLVYTTHSDYIYCHVYCRYTIYTVTFYTTYLCYYCL